MTRPAKFIALATESVLAWRDRAPDANGMPAERAVSDGGGNPCRHCLRDIQQVFRDFRADEILDSRVICHVMPSLSHDQSGTQSLSYH